MKHIVKHIVLPFIYDLHRLTADSRPLFLDIETTGLSPERAHIDLIGCLFPSDADSNSSSPDSSCWEFHQWLAENRMDEENVLVAFQEFVRSFSLLVHFNGEHFDIPFLHARASKWGISDSFLTIPGLDLWKKCNRLKRLLRLPNTKLKTMERFLGICREDQYNGGELIQIYKEYVRKHDSESEHLLLLHNEEDILNMPALLPMLAYTDLLSGNYHVTEILTCSTTNSSDPSHCFVDVDLRLDLFLPQPVFFEEACWKGILKKDVLHLSIPVISGELKYFFPNYKDYYYLPEEDTAIHKSVAEFVDKGHRKKAAPNTAYIRHEGSFLPIPGRIRSDDRVFRTEYRGDMFLELNTALPQDTEFWDTYAHLLSCRLI